MCAFVSPAQDSTSSDTATYISAPEPDITVISGDSLTDDSVPGPKIHNGLTYDQTLSEKVLYQAADSQLFDLSEKVVHLYGKASVKYGNIELKADYIAFYFESNQVFASGLPDTSGSIAGKPVFLDKGQEYQADTIRYNFKTQKGYIKQIGTSINDGHVYGRTVKKTPDEVMYIRDGEFCPCEDKDAKTRIHVKKIKVIPNKKIITGPWNLRIGKIPTPLAFFMGYFPNNPSRSAGILIPTYGESERQGFFLLNGGWYQPLSERMDLQVTGSGYSKGSWGARTLLRYNHKYRFNGNLNLTYDVNRQSLRDLPDFTENRNFFIRWSHTQDPKARPNSRFNASVNAGSNATFQNTLNSNITDYVSNTFQSSVRYSKSWPGKPFNLNLGASHNQDTRQRTFNINLPEVGFTVSRVYLPLSFLKGEKTTKTKWFEKIGINYSMNAANRLTVSEDELKLDNLTRLRQKMRNGVRHNTSLQTNLKAWHFTINPSFRLTERWAFNSIRRFYDNDSQRSVTDTLPGFKRAHDYAFSTGVTTKLYGMFTYKRGPVQAIRHVMIPSVNVNYRPAFSTRRYGFFGNNGAYSSYSPLETGIYGTPPEQESGGMGFNLQNNLEMKVRQRKDGEVVLKKISLIDNFNASTNFDMLRDSLKWNNINVNARTKLFKSLNLTYNASFDPYNYNDQTGGRLNESLWKARRKLARMINTRFAAGWNFSLGKGDGEKGTKGVSRWVGFTGNANYNLNLNRNFIGGKDTIITTQSVSVSGDLKLFGKATIGYFTGYDFTQKEFTPTTLNLYVDLNCWELRINYVPFGFRKSYGVTLNMKSALLKDVKLERKRNLSDEDLVF